MNDWIDDEVNQIKNDNAAKANDATREKAIASQSSALWADLRYLIEESVKKLNNTPEISRKTGDVRFNGTNIDILKVDKLVFPAVHITITREYASIHIERLILRNGGSIENVKEKRESERLQYDLDHEGNIFLRASDRKPLRAQDAVGYVLKPLMTQ